MPVFLYLMKGINQ